MKKYTIVFICFILSLSTLFGQSQSDYQKWLEKERIKRSEYVEKRIKDYAAFRSKRNSEFSKFLKQRWTTYEIIQGIKKQAKPKPTLPIKITSEVRKAPAVMVPSIVGNIPVVKLNPILPPLSDLKLSPTVVDDTVVVVNKDLDIIKDSILKKSFIFLGSYLTTLPDNLDFSFEFIDENSISKSWKSLSTSTSGVTCLESCLKIREKLQLCDWAYIQLCNKIGHYYSSSSNNKALFIQAYLLAQTGYEMRLARQNSNLLLLMPALEKVYAKPYFKMSGHRYYIVDGNYSKGSIQSYDKSLNYIGHHINLRIDKPMNLNFDEVLPRELKSRKYPWVKFDISSNKELIDFYKSYPQSEWDVYPSSVVEPRLLHTLDSVMPTILGGLSMKVKVNSLLNFVQTAFKYQTDNDQFGREKPFFIEETFYYPYCDCEDRSTLFAFLVKRYLSLDVVLIAYPNHMATAVNTNGLIKGDYIEYKGNNYTICDPTFINAPAGKCMPQFKNSTCTIFPLLNSKIKS